MNIDNNLDQYDNHNYQLEEINNYEQSQKWYKHHKWTQEAMTHCPCDKCNKYYKCKEECQHFKIYTDTDSDKGREINLENFKKTNNQSL